MRFILNTKVPHGTKVTYGNFIYDICPLEDETHRICLTVRGGYLDYEEDPSCLAVSLLDNKIMLNSIILDASKEARLCTSDINILYLKNPMKTYRYMKIPLKYFTPEVRHKHNIDDIVQDGYGYTEICK